MHIPDGFLDAPTSIATGVVAASAVGLSLRRSARELGESGPVLAGLVACFVFAVQMVNFPVGAGTSGHLLGGALAAALVGPWTGILVMACVLLVQGLFFADGGLTALGSNITLMGVVGVAVAYAVMSALLRVLPRRPSSVVPAVAVGALASVPAAAACFALLFAVGGQVPIDVATLTTAMVGWHVLIGIGEALITSAVVGAVLATRPDLVHVARHLRPDLVLVGADGSRTTVAADAPAPAVRVGRRGAAVGLAAALLVGGGLSLFASSHPDGLEYVAGRLGFERAAQDSAVAGGPLADYEIHALGGTIGAAGAGVLGVLLTLTLALAVAWVARRGAPDSLNDAR